MNLFNLNFNWHREELIRYFEVDDDRTDCRIDVRSKHPRWGQDQWPQDLVEKLLNHVLKDPFVVEEVIFHESKISYRLHADSGNGDNQRLYKAVLIPLSWIGNSATVFFNNYWQGASAKFSRTHSPQLSYTLLDRNDNKFYVDDLEIFLQQCKTDPQSLEANFDIDQSFVQHIEYLISARKNQRLAPIDPVIDNYSLISNINDNKFDREIHSQFLSHIPIENLHGLTVQGVVPWQHNTAIVFDRTQIHCAAHGHQSKLALTVFTQRA